MGERERVVDGLVRELEDLERLRLVEADAPFEDLLAGDVEDHAGSSRVGCSTPSGSFPRTGAIFVEVVEVAPRGQVRLARPGSDHNPEAGEAAALDRLHGQGRVVERAEAGAGDDDQRRVEEFRHVGDGAAAELHEQPAGALDDDPVVIERLDEVGDLSRRDRRQAGARGGRGGRERVGVAGERVHLGAGELPDGRGIVVVAGLRGLHVGGVGTASAAETYVLPTPVSVPVTTMRMPVTIAAAIRATSSSSVTYGGIA